MTKITFEQELESSRNRKVREDIRQDIINQMWDLWITVTFPYIAGADSAEQKIKEFFVNINRYAKCQMVDKRTHMFICYEKHDTKKGAHAHLFVRGINPDNVELLQGLLNKKIGNSLVKPYDPTKRAAGYVAAKYDTPTFIFCKWLTLHPKKFKPASNPCNLSSPQLTTFSHI